MPTVRVIPCLDVRDGRVVKGVKFMNLRDAGSPVEQAALYESQGADELVMLDVSATKEGRRAALATVKAIRNVLSIPLTVGGGVRTIEDAIAMLSAGADKIGVNTAAVNDPQLLTTLADRFGVQCIVLAIDAIADRSAASPNSPPAWHVVVRSGEDRRPLDAVSWARTATSLGAGEILLTSVDRDGTQAGYDLALIQAVSQAVRVPVIASGGAAHAQHMVEAVQSGADAVLAASIFHDGLTSVHAVKAQMHNAGLSVRHHAPLTRA